MKKKPQGKGTCYYGLYLGELELGKMEGIWSHIPLGWSDGSVLGHPEQGET